MAAVTIHSDFGAQEKKICHCFYFLPFYLPWSDGTRCHDLHFFKCWVLSQLSLSSFTLIKRLLSSSSLSAIRVLSSAYLRFLIFFLAILILAYESSTPAFHVMHSAYNLNKQGDNIQPCCTPFPILNQSVVLCKVLNVASWPTYRFLRRQARWSGIPISKNFPPQFVLIYTVKGFYVVNETEVEIFLEFPCFLYDPMNVGNLISGCSAFSKPSLYIWNFSIQVLLKPSLKEELPYDQVIPLLSICFLKIIIIWKDTCTPMLTGALFKIAKIWKQPKCALVDEWIKRCGVHIYNGIPLSQKKVWNLTIWGFPGGSDGKESACNARDPGLIPGLGRSPGTGKRAWQLTLVFLPGEYHGQRSLRG